MSSHDLSMTHLFQVTHDVSAAARVAAALQGVPLWHVDHPRYKLPYLLTLLEETGLCRLLLPQSTFSINQEIDVRTFSTRPRCTEPWVQELAGLAPCFLVPYYDTYLRQAS